MKNVIITESGIERNTAAVARMLPRNSRIITAVRNNPMPPSRKHGGNGLLHEKRLVENHVSLQLRRNIAQHGDGLFDAVDDRDRIGVAALLQNRRVHRFLAVDAHDVVLQGRAVHGLAHVGKEDGFLAFGLERNLIQGRRRWAPARWCRCCNPCGPMRTSPAGRIRLDSFMARTTSIGLSSCACNFSGSTYTMIWRYFPP